MPEVEHEELPAAPRPLGFREHTAQQIDVALRVEDDHHLAATDVLGDQQLGQARLADARGSQHQRVPDPILQVHPDLALVGLDTVDAGSPPTPPVSSAGTNAANAPAKGPPRAAAGSPGSRASNKRWV